MTKTMMSGTKGIKDFQCDNIVQECEKTLQDK